MRGWAVRVKWMMLVVGLFSFSAWAEETQKETKRIPMLDEVFVTAGRVEEPIKELSTQVTIIDNETIENSPYLELGDLLAEQGFAVRKYPGGLTSVGIRGFRTEGLGYLPWKWLKLRTNYAEGFVMPEADQLAADFPAFGGRRYVGNPRTGLPPSV